MPKAIAAVAALLASGILSATEEPRVEFGAIGAFRVGMSERQVAKAARSPLVHIAPEAEEEGCFYGSVNDLPQGVSLMFVDGLLARIDISSPGVLTSSGAEVGMSERTVKRIYGAKLRQEPRAYIGPEGHYLTLLSPDQTRGIRFETDGSKVTGYYSGTTEAIQFIEGCQ